MRIEELSDNILKLTNLSSKEIDKWVSLIRVNTLDGEHTYSPKKNYCARWYIHHIKQGIEYAKAIITSGIGVDEYYIHLLRHLVNIELEYPELVSGVWEKYESSYIRNFKYGRSKSSL
jgi:UDP-N-acetyl-D-mannosaminuronic acid transferase (WecB/TagA/CpsF family)